MDQGMGGTSGLEDGEPAGRVDCRQPPRTTPAARGNGFAHRRLLQCLEAAFPVTTARIAEIGPPPTRRPATVSLDWHRSRLRRLSDPLHLSYAPCDSTSSLGEPRQWPSTPGGARKGDRNSRDE